MNILIIEDDKNSASLMAHFMKRYGTCDIARDGLEGLAKVLEAFHENKHYDLLVVDIMMPNMNGLDTLQKIKEIENNHLIPKDKQAKSIVISALDGDTVRIESYERGSLAFIRKPVDFIKLENIMKDEFDIQIRVES
jgi:two-component system chemotaxis response regulator CheY